MTWLLALQAALALAMPEAAQASAPTSVAPKAFVRLERWRTRWLLPVTIAGKPRRLLFDTAGGLTLVSPSVADDAGCKPWGRLTGFRMFGDRGDTPRCSDVTFAVPGYQTRLPATGLIDLGKLNPADAGLDGLASLNLFDGEAVTLDFANGTLTVESDTSLAERTRAMTPVKVRLSREVQGLALAVLIEVPTTKGPVWMELDSGNGGTVLVSKHIADLVGLNPAVEGKQRARFTVTTGVEVDSADAFTPDIILDGNLGMPFLKRWVLTIDLRRGTAWLAPAMVST